MTPPKSRNEEIASKIQQTVYRWDDIEKHSAPNLEAYIFNAIKEALDAKDAIINSLKAEVKSLSTSLEGSYEEKHALEAQLAEAKELEALWRKEFPMGWNVTYKRMAAELTETRQELDILGNPGSDMTDGKLDELAARYVSWGADVLARQKVKYQLAAGRHAEEAADARKKLAEAEKNIQLYIPIAEERNAFQTQAGARKREVFDLQTKLSIAQQELEQANIDYAIGKKAIDKLVKAEAALEKISQYQPFNSEGLLAPNMDPQRIAQEALASSGNTLLSGQEERRQ
mgnify:CR=1 FL=1